MDPIYRATGRELDGKPVIQQLEVQGRETDLYELRHVFVWAVDVFAARAIQRDWRADQ